MRTTQEKTAQARSDASRAAAEHVVQASASAAPCALQSQTEHSPSSALVQRLQAEADRSASNRLAAQLQQTQEEELVQGRFETAQRAEEEEEDLIQGRFAQLSGRSEPIQRKVDPTMTVNGVPVNDDPALEHEADVMGAKAAQFVASPEEEDPLQGKFGDAAQRQPNRTGLPDNLKAGVEHLSGMSMDGVRVHYSSSKPAQLNALAYAQGKDIHLGPGQEKHLPHEAWHVVQQNKTNPLVSQRKKMSPEEKSLLEIGWTPKFKRDHIANQNKSITENLKEKRTEHPNDELTVIFERDLKRTSIKHAYHNTQKNVCRVIFNTTGAAKYTNSQNEGQPTYLTEVQVYGDLSNNAVTLTHITNKIFDW